MLAVQQRAFQRLAGGLEMPARFRFDVMREGTDGQRPIGLFDRQEEVRHHQVELAVAGRSAVVLRNARVNSRPHRAQVGHAGGIGVNCAAPGGIVRGQ
jgi:hypothetical protein